MALIGESDEMTNAEMRSWARDAIGDVRDVDTDHFILFNRPEVRCARSGFGAHHMR